MRRRREQPRARARLLAGGTEGREGVLVSFIKILRDRPERARIASCESAVSASGLGPEATTCAARPSRRLRRVARNASRPPDHHHARPLRCLPTTLLSTPSRAAGATASSTSPRASPSTPARSRWRTGRSTGCPQPECVGQLARSPSSPAVAPLPPPRSSSLTRLPASPRLAVYEVPRSPSGRWSCAGCSHSSFTAYSLEAHVGACLALEQALKLGLATGWHAVGGELGHALDEQQPAGVGHVGADVDEVGGAPARSSCRARVPEPLFLAQTADTPIPTLACSVISSPGRPRAFAPADEDPCLPTTTWCALETKAHGGPAVPGARGTSEDAALATSAAMLDEQARSRGHSTPEGRGSGTEEHDGGGSGPSAPPALDEYCADRGGRPSSTRSPFTPSSPLSSPPPFSTSLRSNPSLRSVPGLTSPKLPRSHLPAAPTAGRDDGAAVRTMKRSSTSKQVSSPVGLLPALTSCDAPADQVVPPDRPTARRR